MVKLTPAQIAELFHLAFLSSLSVGNGENAYVLKGGANLRYFFNSQRYSEDIDLDVVRIRAWKLEEQVDRTLGSATLNRLLRSSGIAIDEFSKPKQTDTTQRWKVGLLAPNRREPVRTKIEFSHRRLDPRYCLETVPESVVGTYAIRPPAIQHYEAGAALEQKVLALDGRSETQARDVFDLDLLFRQASLERGATDDETRRRAMDRALELPYDSYRDQVLPFLEPELLAIYEGPDVWESMLTFVARKLEEEDEVD